MVVGCNTLVSSGPAAAALAHGTLPYMGHVHMEHFHIWRMSIWHMEIQTHIWMLSKEHTVNIPAQVIKHRGV